MSRSLWPLKQKWLKIKGFFPIFQKKICSTTFSTSTANKKYLADPSKKNNAGDWGHHEGKVMILRNNCSRCRSLKHANVVLWVNERFRMRTRQKCFYQSCRKHAGHLNNCGESCCGTIFFSLPLSRLFGVPVTSFHLFLFLLPDSLPNDSAATRGKGPSEIIWGEEINWSWWASWLLIHSKLAPSQPTKSFKFQLTAISLSKTSKSLSKISNPCPISPLKFQNTWDQLCAWEIS